MIWSTTSQTQSALPVFPRFMPETAMQTLCQNMLQPSTSTALRSRSAHRRGCFAGFVKLFSRVNAVHQRWQWHQICAGTALKWACISARTPQLIAAQLQESRFKLYKICSMCSANLASRNSLMPCINASAAGLSSKRCARHVPPCYHTF